MKIIFRILMIAIVITALGMPSMASEPGTSESKPNVSGGYDFYDTSGAKTGSSSRRPDGGYDYFDQHGNKTGSLVQDVDTGAYEYRDAENINRGSLKSDPYGGYRYKTRGEDTITAEQTNIRRSYGYADTYGSGIETLSPDVLRGLDADKKSGKSDISIKTSAPTEEGLSTITSAD